MKGKQTMEKKNILLTAMSLGIGGAETHIFELARELHRRGHKVTVASAGGPFADRLEQIGIRHVCLPMHRKNPLSMLCAYRGLMKLVKEEKQNALKEAGVESAGRDPREDTAAESAGSDPLKAAGFEILHAHARIPAFLSRLVGKACGIPMVTTCHGQYRAGFLWKRASHWGDYSLAVSNDIKAYLIGNYSLFPDNIAVTVNAIDTHTFSPQGEAAGGHDLLYVSRIDKEVAEIGFTLVSLAQRLNQRFPDIRLHLVGSGTAFADLKAQADAANAACGREVVVLYGARTDVHTFMKRGGLFVGVSRAALEAMASGMDVILAGAEGYLGALNAERLDDALATNFCCRDSGKCESEALFDEIVSRLSLSVSQREEAGRFNRAVVEEHYTITRMGDDAEALYDRAVRTVDETRRVLISGYYGFGNMGDDSLLQVMVRDLRRLDPTLSITVISNNPRQTAEAYHVKSIRRFDLIALRREQKKGGLLISGGGSLLTNATSMRSLVYYSYIINSCKRAGMKVMLYANGIGPFYGEKASAFAKKALLSADRITLREPSSLRELERLGVGRKDVEVTVDPAFGLEPDGSDWTAYRMRRDGLPAGNRFFAVCIRSWHGADGHFAEKIASACRAIREKHGLTPVFLPMQLSKDLRISEECAASCGGIVCGGHVNSGKGGRLCATEAVSLLAEAEFVIGMRLHALIYAFSAGRPLIGLSYDPKIDALLASLAYPYKLSAADLDAEALVDYADEVLRNRTRLSEDVKESLRPMKQKAESNASIALACLDGRA